MSRLHAILTGLTDIAAHFGIDPVPDVSFDREVTEGCRGLIVRESQGRRILQAMDWGFPRMTREMREKGEDAGRIGLVADLTNPLWEETVVDPRYRCLIVLTHFANPDGEAGEMTRTWFSLRERPIMAWAGFCRNTPAFGPVHAGMTMTANDLVMRINDRMPVLLAPNDYDVWLRGSIEDVIRFQFRAPLDPGQMEEERTDDLWRTGGLPVQRTLNL